MQQYSEIKCTLVEFVTTDSDIEQRFYLSPPDLFKCYTSIRAHVLHNPDDGFMLLHGLTFGVET